MVYESDQKCRRYNIGFFLLPPERSLLLQSDCHVLFCHGVGSAGAGDGGVAAAATAGAVVALVLCYLAPGIYMAHAG